MSEQLLLLVSEDQCDGLVNHVKFIFLGDDDQTLLLLALFALLVGVCVDLVVEGTKLVLEVPCKNAAHLGQVVFEVVHGER